MKEGPIYVYDNRTQYQEPVAVVYDTDHVAMVIQALYGTVPDYICTSKCRQHPYERDRYDTHMKSNKDARKKTW